MAEANTRAGILDAVARILIRDGAGGLTIATAAAEAGVSRGGIFHHFSSKTKLVEALIDRVVGGFDAQLAQADHEPGAFTRTYLHATVAGEGAVAAQPAVSALVAAALDPALLEPLRERYREWQRRIANDGIDPAVSSLVRMAADGIWMADAFALAPLTGEPRRKTIAALSALIDDAPLS